MNNTIQNPSLQDPVCEALRRLIDEDIDVEVALPILNDLAIAMREQGRNECLAEQAAEVTVGKTREREMNRVRKQRQRNRGKPGIPETSDVTPMSRDCHADVTRDSHADVTRDSHAVGGTIGGVLANGREKVEEVGVCTNRGNQLADSAIPDTNIPETSDADPPPPEVDTRSPIEKFPILADPRFLGYADEEVEL